MDKESKICQNCKTTFSITDEDQKFYDKIKVPPPTFCPECRLQRRLVPRNMRTLYFRNCDLCGKNILSIYHKDSVCTVYCQKCWWGDNWDPMKEGKDYDFNKTFFEQWHDLFKKVPLPNLLNDSPDKMLNSSYCNSAWNVKNCYLCVTVGESEDCYYSTVIVYSKNIYDSIWTVRSDRCYKCIDCYNSYNCYFSQNIDNCMDSYFLLDCRNCNDCFGCVGLRHKKYQIFNKKYSKEEYFNKINKFNLGSFKNLEKTKIEFEEHKIKFPRKYAILTNCVNVFGNNVRNSKNCSYCFDVILKGGVENSKYVIYAGLDLKDSYDSFDAGTHSELFYECMAAGDNCHKILFSNWVWKNSYEIYYSHTCVNSSNLFGCVGIRKKQYCILNKQYTKDEYEKLVLKIIEHMNDMLYIDERGRIYKYGEFFPAELSPFGYNETTAQEYFPLPRHSSEGAEAGLTEKEFIEQQGYKYTDIKKYKRAYDSTVKDKDLPDSIKNVNDSILNEVIECGNTDSCYGIGVFKIIEKELDFYRKQNLPLPRLCPDCRYYEMNGQRNPVKLWHRKCQCAGKQSENSIYTNTIEHSHHGTNHCPNKFQTTYSPERKEIVYCEDCYLREVV